MTSICCFSTKNDCESPFHLQEFFQISRKQDSDGVLKTSRVSGAFVAVSVCDLNSKPPSRKIMVSKYKKSRDLKFQVSMGLENLKIDLINVSNTNKDLIDSNSKFCF